MNKIEHIGIAVKNMDQAIDIYTKLLNVACYKKEYVDSENVHTAFFKNGPNKIELLATTEGESAITKYLEKKGEGIHHIAFEVDDILSEMDRLRNEGFTILNEQPKKGADNKLICFVHPRDAHGVLIELCQEITL